MNEKIPVRIKDIPEDFIVEEVGENWTCTVSKPFNPLLFTDISNLEKNPPQDFVWCEMEKRDMDHFQAVKDVSRLLNLSIPDIGYAGTKDKAALTSQRISLFKPSLEALQKFHHDKIILKNFSWAKRKIKIGYLNENKFTITVRELPKKDAIKKAQDIRSMDFFPNYFGMQRFGSLRKNNVAIGTLILKRKFKEALWKILTEESGEEREEVTLARKRLKKEKDFGKALEYFPYNLRMERQILHSLSRNPEDMIGAIRCTDKKTMLLIINSVQSSIFNEILRRALEEGLDFTKKGQESCLLVGYKTRFYQGRLGTIEQEVLQEHGLELKDFDILEIPYLRIKGSFRKAITKVSKSSVDIEDDELYPGTKKLILSFQLPSGVYATTYLENFFLLKQVH